MSRDLASRWLVLVVLLGACGSEESPPTPRDRTPNEAEAVEAENETTDPTPPDEPPAPAPFGDLRWADAEHARYVGLGVGMSGIHALVFSPDSRYVAAGANDGALSVIDATTGRVVASTQVPEEGPIRFEITFRGDTLLANYSLAYGSGYRSVVVWRWREGRTPYFDNTGSQECALSTDGERFACFGHPFFIADARTDERVELSEDTLDGSGVFVRADRILSRGGRGHRLLDASPRRGRNLVSLGEFPADRFAVGPEHVVFQFGAEVFFVASADGHEISRARHALTNPTRLVVSEDGSLAALSNGTASLLIHRDDGRMEPLAFDVVGLTNEIAVIEEADGSLRRMVLEGRRVGMRLAPPPPEATWHEEVFGVAPIHAAVAPSGIVAGATGGVMRADGSGETQGSLRVITPTATTTPPPNGRFLNIRSGRLSPSGDTLVVDLEGGGAVWLSAAATVVSTCSLHFLYPRIDFARAMFLNYGQAGSIRDAGPRRDLFTRNADGEREESTGISDDTRFVLGSRGTLLDRSTGASTTTAVPPDVCDIGFHDDERCGGETVFSPDGRFVWVIGFAIHHPETNTVLLEAGRNTPRLDFEGQRSAVFSSDSRFLVHAGEDSLAIEPLGEGETRWLVGNARRVRPSESPLALSPDDSTIAYTSGSDHSVQLFLTADGTSAGTVETTGPVTRLRWSRSGQQLLVDTDHALGIYDRRTRALTEVGRRTGHGLTRFGEPTRAYCLGSRLRVIVDDADGDFDALDLAPCTESQALPSLEGDGRFLVFTSGGVLRVRRLASGAELFVIAYEDTSGRHWLAHDPAGHYQSATPGVPAWLGVREPDGTVRPLNPADRDDGLLARFFGG